MRSPRVFWRRWVTPRPRKVTVSPDWAPTDVDLAGAVEGFEVEWRPRAAAVIGTSSVACRSSPRRWNIRWLRTAIST